jgi:hypothetical protein
LYPLHGTTVSASLEPVRTGGPWSPPLSPTMMTHARNNDHSSPMLTTMLKQIRMGRAYDRAWSHPRERITPLPMSASASEKTPPRPSSISANCPDKNSPRIPQESISTTVLTPPCITACPEQARPRPREILLSRPSLASA